MFFSTLKMDNIVESAEIDLSEFRNQMGGALALYLGISFVSFFEVVELILRVVLSLLGLVRNRNERKCDYDLRETTKHPNMFHISNIVLNTRLNKN